MSDRRADFRPPSFAKLLGEARTAFEVPRLVAQGPSLRRVPRGRGEAASVLLGQYVEEMKASGFVAQSLARHRIQGASVAPAARL